MTGSSGPVLSTGTQLVPGSPLYEYAVPRADTRPGAAAARHLDGDIVAASDPCRVPVCPAADGRLAQRIATADSRPAVTF